MTDPLTIDFNSVKFLSKNDFGSLVDSRQAIDNEIKELKKQLKTYNEEIEAMMISANMGDSVVRTNLHTVRIISSYNSRIDQQKLLEHGVEPGIIVAATVKKEYSYVKVSEVK